MPDYSLIKTVHVACVIASGAGFALRGAWMLTGSRLLHHRATRVLPHLVDTLLLASALSLMLISAQYPTTQPWIAAKMVALLVYIVLGSVALKRGRAPALRGLALVAAITTFGYIVAVALTRDPMPLPGF